MNLKKFLDAANAAEARVQQIAAQIDEYFEAGETDKALALKGDLDTAKAKAQEAHDLYVSMANATSLVPAVGQLEVLRDEADQPFRSDGEFFMAVKIAGLYPGREDPRLRSLKFKDATGLSEGVPAEGGYLLQPQTAGGILERMYNVGRILSLVARDPVGPNSNSMAYNGVDETSRVNGSRQGGVVGYWVAEAGEITGSHPKWYQYDLKLKGVAALCYATDDQLMDTANLDSWLGRVVPEELRFLAEDAIIEGNGVGKPLGILNAPCLVTVTRADANEINFADIVNMWARRWAGLNDYVWLVNQDVTPQLDQMVIGTDAPPRFVDYGVDGVMRMKGRPVYEIEYCQSMGTKGDIYLAALSQYQTIQKSDVQSSSSIHVAYVTQETAFRFTWRIDGQPSWHSDLTPLHGSNDQSPFIALATASA